MALSIVSFLLAYVVPKVVQVFENTDQALPILTRMLIGLSDFVRDYYLAIGLVVILLLVGFSALMKRSPVKRLVHRQLLKLPVIGTLVKGSNTARFTRTLSILAASGVPVLDSLRIAGQVIGNLPMRSAVETTAIRVREGASLAKSLEQEGYFPPMVVNLIASGETGGNLDEMLERAAVNQEREMKTRINMLMGLLEPLLLVVMGGVVLIIVMAILQPIFDMNKLIG
jgi:general secretion pathway protein F